MYRCLRVAAVCASAVAFTLPAAAQVQRNFPANALRGELAVVAPPQVRLNAQQARLAPGARIRAENNLIVMPASLVGRELAVHYTVDSDGQLRDVWILQAHELARKPWPTTPRQAQTWSFDPAAQVWTQR